MCPALLECLLTECIICVRLSVLVSFRWSASFRQLSVCELLTACAVAGSTSVPASLYGACLRRCRCLERACGAVDVLSVPAAVSMSGACLRRCRCLERACGAVDVLSVPAALSTSRACLRRCRCLERACGAVWGGLYRAVDVESVQTCGAVHVWSVPAALSSVPACAMWSAPAALLGA